MTRFLDFTFLKLAVFLLLFCWLTYFIDFWWALAIAALGFFAVSAIIGKYGKTSDKKNAELYQKQFFLLGADKLLSLYLNREVNAKYDIDGLTLTYCAYKASKVVTDEIAAIYQLAEKYNVDKVTLLLSGIDRGALLFAESLPLSFEYLYFKDIYKLIKKENRLPQTIAFSKPKFGIKLSAVKEVALSKRALLYYLFTGATLSAFAFITPLKLYYLIMASLSLLMAVASALYNAYRNY